MRFCLPLLAHAPLHHGLSRCSPTEVVTLASPLQVNSYTYPPSCICQHFPTIFTCGVYVGAQATRDALQRTRIQVQRGPRIDTLSSPKPCQGALAVCCDCMQAQLVGNRPALKEDVIACALVVLEVLLQQIRTVGATAAQARSLCADAEHAGPHGDHEPHVHAEEVLSALHVLCCVEHMSPLCKPHGLPHGCIIRISVATGNYQRQRLAARRRIDGLQCAMREITMLSTCQIRIVLPRICLFRH